MRDDGLLWLLGGVIAVGVLLIALLVYDMVWAVPYQEQGVIVGKTYTPSRDSIGSGVSSSGKPVVVTTHDDEQYTAIVNINGAVVSARISAQNWASLTEGQPVMVTTFKGALTGGLMSRIATTTTP